MNGTGGINVVSLSAPVTEQTTYDTVPSAGSLNKTISDITPGNEYLVSSYDCPAGQRVAVEISSTEGLALHWFQDYNPSPIGLYITVC